MARCLEWCDASHPPVWNLSSCFCTSEPAVTIIIALNLRGVGIGPWHFLFVWENFRSRLHLNVCTLVHRCRKASEQRMIRRLTDVVHVIWLEHRMQVLLCAAASQPACCMHSGCCTIPTVCLWSEDLWYNEETPLEVKKWTVIVMILQDKWTGYIRSLIPVRVAPICTCIYFAGNKVIKHPDDNGRALLLVKRDYLKWGYAAETVVTLLWIDQSGFRSDRGLQAAWTWPWKKGLQWSL